MRHPKQQVNWDPFEVVGGILCRCQTDSCYKQIRQHRNMKLCISSKTTWRSWCIHWYRLNTANSSKVLSPCTVSIGILEIFGNLWLQKNLPTMVTRCEAPSEGFVQVPCSAGAVSEYEPMGVWIGKWQFHRYKTQGNYGQRSVKVAWWKYGVQIKV